RKIIQTMGGDVRGRRVAVLGLTFKANTDDMREAPSIPIIQGLQDHGAEIAAYDPEGTEQAKLVLSGVTYESSPYHCARDADALVIVTEWEQFRALDLRRLKEAMRTPVLVDLRNLYRAADARKHGFTYVSIGRR
ncbi:MAG: UDP-glucose 6-dehydrogenase, partial [Hyphomicrobiales bacterium]|nr:UDP-glucose 6-dehydrogenase [Hyphomicrobiales bacterium]